jgi:hypothetical protein
VVFFTDEFEVKKCLADLLDKVTYGQAEAICIALEKWDELKKTKKELEFTRQYIHDNGLEFDLLSKYERSDNNNGR